MISKIWVLDNPSVEDIIWARGLDCSIRYDDEITENLSTYSLTVRVVIHPPRLTITSTCEKQESMLKLKYGDSLRLMQVYNEHGI